MRPVPPAHHDALFRRLLADPSIAAAAIAGALPPEVRAMLDLSSLSPVATAHVDDALHAFHSDLVFAAKLAGREALVLVLLEHQSTDDALMPFRLLQYAVLLWDSYLRDHPSAKRLPLIVPIVVHQGPGEWRAPRDLLEVLDLTEAEAAVLGRYVPRMGFTLDDLGATDDAALLRRGMPPEATLALAALRDVRAASDVPALFARWGDLRRRALASPSGLRAVSTVIRYILQVHPEVDFEELRDADKDPEQGLGDEAMTTVQQFIDIGVAKGKAEGKTEGRRATLRRLVRLKFKDQVTERMLSALDAADDVQLDVLEERILTAATVDELLS